MDEHALWQTWTEFGARLTWQRILDKPHNDSAKQAAQSTLSKLPDITPIEALHANAELVDLLIGQRWYVMQAAREAGATWDEIGQTLGMSRQGAYDWYKRAIAKQEQYVPDFHDTDRAQAVLDTQ